MEEEPLKRPLIVEEEEEENKVKEHEKAQSNTLLTQEILRFSEKVLEKLYSRA